MMQSPEHPPRHLIAMPFDPVERSQAAEEACMRSAARRYHRFRAAKYYGGIVTADAVGCSFLCAFCWNYRRNADPGRCGSFFSPQQVVERMAALAHRSGYRLFRITGSEPVLGERSLEHLMAVIAGIRARIPEAEFVLETNGLILGFRPDSAERIPAEGVAVRVAIKGTDEGSFERITGARKEFFDYPFRAILCLERRGIHVWPAVMGDMHTREELRSLRHHMQTIGIRSPLETETLERYPSVVENLALRGIAVR